MIRVPRWLDWLLGIHRPTHAPPPRRHASKALLFCPQCGARTVIDYIDVSAHTYVAVIPGRWHCPNGCT